MVVRDPSSPASPAETATRRGDPSARDRRKEDGRRQSPPRQTDATPDRSLQAYRELRDLIVRGTLAPGTRIVESAIVRRLASLRAPVRDAIRRLQQEGYITEPAATGSTRPADTSLTREDARELYDIVAELEGLAARNAAALPDEQRKSLAEQMQVLNARLSTAAKAHPPDHPAIAQLDEAFHGAYVRAGAGPRLLALHEAVKPQAQRYVWLYAHVLAHEVQPGVEEHAAIIRAIDTGDAAAAERAVLANWHNAARRLSAVIEQSGERGRW